TPTPIVNASGPTTFCSGGSVTLSTTSTGTYQWFNGATLIATTPAVTVSTSGSYTVTVTTGSCSATSAPTTVTVNSPPTPTITPSGPTTFCAGGSVTLTTPTIAGAIYQWVNGADSL